MAKPVYEDMTNVPLEESDLIEDPIFWTMKKQIVVSDYMTSNDIQTPILKLIFQNRFKEAEEMIFDLCYENKWD